MTSKAKPTIGTADNRRAARFSEQNGKGSKPHDPSEDDPAQLVSKIHLLEKDLERRQESYVSRERA